MSGLPFGEFYSEVFLNGSMQMAKAMTRLSHPGEPNRRSGWMKYFEFYYAFCIKYVIPAGLWWMLLESIRERIRSIVDGDSTTDPVLQWVGLIFPVVGFILFLVPVFKPIGSEEDYQQCQEAIDKMVYGKGVPSSDNAINADGPGVDKLDNKVSPS